jgi:hypothetical protein
VCGHAFPVPHGAAGLERLPEPAALAERGGERDQPATGDRQHRTHSGIEVVGNTSSFIDDQEVDFGEAADGALFAGECVDLAAIAELERKQALSGRWSNRPESAIEATYDAQQPLRLPLSR